MTWIERETNSETMGQLNVTICIHMLICVLEVGESLFYITVNWGERKQSNEPISSWCFCIITHLICLFFLRSKIAIFEASPFLVFSHFEHPVLTTCRLDSWMENSSCQLESMLVTVDCSGAVAASGSHHKHRMNTRSRWHQLYEISTNESKTSHDISWTTKKVLISSG